MWLHHQTFRNRFYLWRFLLCSIIYIDNRVINSISRVFFWWSRSVSSLSNVQSPFLVCGCDTIYRIFILRNELRIDLSSILTLFVNLVNLLLIILICKKLIVMFLNLVLRFLYCLRNRKYDVSNICHPISIGSRISLRWLRSSCIRLDLGFCLSEINCLKVWCLCLSKDLRVLIFLIIYCWWS